MTELSSPKEPLRVCMAKPLHEMASGTDLSSQMLRLILTYLAQHPEHGRIQDKESNVRVHEWAEGRIYYTVAEDRLFVLAIEPKGAEPETRARSVLSKLADNIAKPVLEKMISLLT